MKKALIDPMNISVTYISGWTDQTPAEPIITDIENAYNIAEVKNQTFEVAEPLFWVDCPDETVAGLWYYSINTSLCLAKNDVPSPNPPLPG